VWILHRAQRPLFTLQHIACGPLCLAADGFSADDLVLIGIWTVKLRRWQHDNVNGHIRTKTQTCVIDAIIKPLP
jgi:hypothetical protein